MLSLDSSDVSGKVNFAELVRNTMAPGEKLLEFDQMNINKPQPAHMGSPGPDL